MGRFLLLLAVVLLGVAIFMLVILVQGGDNEWANTIFQMALCKGNEEFVQELGDYIPGGNQIDRYGGYEVAFYCEDKEGEQRDVTLSAIGIMAAGFVIPFLASLILFFIAIGTMIRNGLRSFTKGAFDISGGTNKWTAYTSQLPQTPMMDMRDGSYQGSQVPQEKIAQAQKIMDSMGLPNFFQAAGGNTLAERLKQLDDARNQGLINETEYQRLRQSILDDIG